MVDVPTGDSGVAPSRASALPSSLYRDTGSAGPPTPPLRGEHRTDVAIVGAGFTGLSTALHLAEAGVSVTVLEAHEPGWGASGRNGGQVNPGLKDGPDLIERRFGADLGQRMNAMSHAGPDLVFDLVRRHQIRCSARQGGTIRLATSAAGAARLRALGVDYGRRGAPVSLLEGEALRDAVGTDHYAAGLLDRRGGDLDPLAYARGLTRAAMQAGAAVHGGSKVHALRQKAGGWELDLPEGRVTATKVLLATNGYTDDLWPGLRRSVVPVYSAITATETLPDAVARAILPLRAAAFETGRITVYYRVDGENRLVLGGRGPQRSIGGPGGLGYLVRHAEHLWPGLAGVRWPWGWNGQLAVTSDHTPHVHAPAPGLLACLGYNGRGVALGTMMGLQLARHLEGGTLDMPMTPIRPIPMHAFWRLGVVTETWRGRLLDRLGR